MKKAGSLLLAFVLVSVLLAGCGGSGTSSAGSVPPQQSTAAPTPSGTAPSSAASTGGMPITSDLKNMSIASAGSSGTFYIMAAAYADLITKNLGINTIAEVTGGSVENVLLLGSSETELGVVQLDVTIDALAGTGSFTESVPLSVICPMYPNVVQIVALADSDINSVADLRGKRVSVGSPGSGVLATNEIILETLGLSMDDIQPQYLSFTETTDAFRNNSVDAVIMNTAAPAPFLVDLETTNAIKMVPLSDDEIKLFTEGFPFYTESVIPGGSYKSVPEDTKTFAVWIALMAREDLPEDVAYNITKTLFESGEFLKDVHVVAQYLNTDSVSYIEGVPYHAGSQKYLEEIGVKVPS